MRAKRRREPSAFAPVVGVPVAVLVARALDRFIQALTGHGLLGAAWPRAMVMTILGLAAMYFAMVFGAGFALGTIRTLWVVPRVGARTAELLELPVMLAAVFLSARWITRRFDVGRTARAWLMVGLVALALLLVAELVLGVALRGVSSKEVLTDRDPVAGGAYYAALCVFAIAPWLLGRRRGRTPRNGPPVGQSRGHGTG